MPTFSPTLPVNAPRAWPKTSASNSVSVNEVQSTVRNGFSRRGDWLWMKLAASSLPVPVSPCKSTGAAAAATSLSCSMQAVNVRAWPTMRL
jgi:hypothetical protein